MAVQSTGRPTGSRPGIAAALHLVLRLLALLVFAQAVFAGLFLDGNTAWRQWHAINGMLLIPLLALLAVVLAVVLWRSGGPSLHRPVRTQREAAMRITVFGATGRTGRYILAEGLRRDHQRTAFTRWPTALVGPSTLAAVAMDDGRDPHTVRRAIDGADAVISTVSAERRKGPNHVAEVSR
jgi:hypothetical protein